MLHVVEVGSLYPTELALARALITIILPPPLGEYVYPDREILIISSDNVFDEVLIKEFEKYFSNSSLTLRMIFSMSGKDTVVQWPPDLPTVGPVGGEEPDGEFEYESEDEFEDEFEYESEDIPPEKEGVSTPDMSGEKDKRFIDWQKGLADRMKKK